MVTEEEFWAVLEPAVPVTALAQLVAALERLSGDEVVHFQEQLARALHALDTAEHQQQPVADLEDDATLGHLPLSDDAFLHARMAVVARGRQAWAEVAAEPGRFAGSWDMQLGEELTGAAAIAYEHVTGEPWIGVDLQPARDEAPALPAPSRHAWFHCHTWPLIGVDDVWLPRSYQAHLEYLREVVNEDQRWWDWWDAARGEPSTLHATISYHRQEKVRSTVQAGKDFAGRDEVNAKLVVPAPDRDRPPTLHQDLTLAWAALARQHLDLVFAAVRRKLDQAALPFELDSNVERAEADRKDRRRRSDQQQRLQLAETAAWQRRRSTEHGTRHGRRRPRRCRRGWEADRGPAPDDRRTAPHLRHPRPCR